MKEILSLLILIISIPLFSQELSRVFEVDSLMRQNKLSEGQIYNIEWKSKYLQENRTITIYEPKGFVKDSTYPVLLVTDGITPYIAGYIDYLISEKLIAPILIVGINLREKQDVDTIFGDYKIDFRAKEMLKIESIQTKNMEVYKDSTAKRTLSGRHPKFLNFVGLEVIPFVKKHFNTSSNNKEWALGGFSNGGAFVYSFSCEFPDLIGNSIVMSPAGNNVYYIEKSTCKFFICVGINEPSDGYISRSIEYLDYFKNQNRPYVYKLFNAGHEWKMWLSFYIESVKNIYKVDEVNIDRSSK